MTQLYLCGCKKGNKISETTIEKWKNTLNSNKIAYTFIEDLCGLVAKDKLKITVEKKSILIGCQPNALNNLLKKRDIDTNAFDFYHADQLVADTLKLEDIPKGESTTISYDEDWKPWYPVLDYDLCTSCQKCLNFCLFGVYHLSNDGEVLVENPENCKDLCPACARTCPTNAIIFPKHHESPIDGGEGEFTDEPGDFLNQIQENNDVYQLLANRRKASGVPLFKADQLKIAEQERKQCNCKKDDN